MCNTGSKLLTDAEVETTLGSALRQQSYLSGHVTFMPTRCVFACSAQCSLKWGLWVSGRGGGGGVMFGKPLKRAFQTFMGHGRGNWPPKKVVQGPTSSGQRFLAHFEGFSAGWPGF